MIFFLKQNSEFIQFENNKARISDNVKEQWIIACNLSNENYNDFD